MNQITNTPAFNYKSHFDILKRLFISANILALSVCVLMRIIFYDLPFILQEELLHLLSCALTASLVAVGLSFAIFAVDGISYLIRKRKYGVGRLSLPTETYKVAMGPVRTTQSGQPYFELQSKERSVA